MNHNWSTLLILLISFLISSEIKAASLIRLRLNSLKTPVQKFKSFTFGPRVFSSLNKKVATSSIVPPIAFSNNYIKPLQQCDSFTSSLTYYCMLVSPNIGIFCIVTAPWTLFCLNQHAYERQAHDFHRQIMSNPKTDISKIPVIFLNWKTYDDRESLYDVALKHGNFFQAHLLKQRGASGLNNHELMLPRDLLLHSAEQDYETFLDAILSGSEITTNLESIPLHKLNRRLQDGHTLISKAVEREDFTLVERLVNLGVDMISPEENNQNLSQADKELNRSIRNDILSDKPVEISISSFSLDILEWIDSDGQSVFKAAINRKNYAVAKELIEMNLNECANLARTNMDQARLETVYHSIQAKVLNSQFDNCLSIVPLESLKFHTPDGRSLLWEALSRTKFKIAMDLRLMGVKLKVFESTMTPAYILKRRKSGYVLFFISECIKMGIACTLCTIISDAKAIFY